MNILLMLEIEKYQTIYPNEVNHWFKAVRTSDIPKDTGACIRYKDKQIAVFNFARRNEWYACQNLCPHKMQMILSLGMIGSAQGEPKVACPYHKKVFSLKTGENLQGETLTIATYPVKIMSGYVYIGFKE